MRVIRRKQIAIDSIPRHFLKSHVSRLFGRSPLEKNHLLSVPINKTVDSASPSSRTVEGLKQGREINRSSEKKKKEKKIPDSEIKFGSDTNTISFFPPFFYAPFSKGKGT